MPALFRQTDTPEQGDVGVPGAPHTTYRTESVHLL